MFHRPAAVAAREPGAIVQLLATLLLQQLNGHPRLSRMEQNLSPNPAGNKALFLGLPLPLESPERNLENANAGQPLGEEDLGWGITSVLGEEKHKCK